MRLTTAVFVTISWMIITLNSSAQTSERGIAVEPANPKGQRWAVVIGVNYYQDDRIGSLSFAVPDALLIEKALIEGGFPADKILVICDEQSDPALKPTFENLRDRLPQWLNLAGPNDTVVVFFSGHGFLKKDGHGFLVPSNGNSSDLAGTSMSMESMNALLTTCMARRKLLLLDCCRNIHGKGMEDQMSGEDLTSAFEDSEGLITIASCQREQKSFESEKLRHGFFTWYLAEALQGHADTNTDRIVDSNELYAYVWDKVRHAATIYHKQQTPVVVKQEVSGVFPVVNVPSSPGIIPTPVVHTTGKPGPVSGALPALPTVVQPPVKSLLWLYTGLPAVLIVIAVLFLWPRRNKARTVIASGGRQRSRISSEE